MPPESSHSRLPALEVLRFFFNLSLAASTHSRGMPESGTGTAVHSSFGLSAVLYL
jgi:hypothetical protein